MAWIVLLLAGAFEIVWAASMKASEGFTRPVWAVATMVSAGLSFWLLAFSMRTLPLGTSYAVWTGLGAAGAFVVGILAFKEPLTLARTLSAGLILAGILGLWLTAQNGSGT